MVVELIGCGLNQTTMRTGSLCLDYAPEQILIFVKSWVYIGLNSSVLALCNSVYEEQMATDLYDDCVRCINLRICMW